MAPDHYRPSTRTAITHSGSPAPDLAATDRTAGDPGAMDPVTRDPAATDPGTPTQPPRRDRRRGGGSGLWLTPC
jgi:hypothetical protein